ncbi:MAG: hypothetical protein IPL87_01195 [Candidatus Moraniibacteriota bacterium]|nr:MAG: hypothetical protein IPL87_01195 [Candidatus Moranbacteria bacterium]
MEFVYQRLQNSCDNKYTRQGLMTKGEFFIGFGKPPRQSASAKEVPFCLQGYSHSYRIEEESHEEKGGLNK